MVQHAFGNDGKLLNADYHEFRQKARETAFSIEEFGEIEIEKYDLDNIEFSGKDNPESYKMGENQPVKGETWARYDIRDLPTHD